MIDGHGRRRSRAVFGLVCYERDFMLSLSDNNQADVVEAFKFTSRYLGDCLILIILIFHKSHIYPTELQLNKANPLDTVAPFLDICLLMIFLLFILLYLII